MLKSYLYENTLEVGLDEAGRGPLFGRVYAAAVIFPPDIKLNNAKIEQGDWIGMIKFGSQVDLLLPANYEIDVEVGNQVITSGFSDIFPSDLPVGEVIKISDERGAFQKSVIVKINENIGSIMNLFVIVDN